MDAASKSRAVPFLELVADANSPHLGDIGAADEEWKWPEEWGILSRDQGSEWGRQRHRQIPQDFPKIADNRPMRQATPFRRIIDAKDSPHLGGYRRRGRFPEMARKWEILSPDYGTKGADMKRCPSRPHSGS